MAGLEQYAGMSLEQKVTVMLVKMDNLESFVMTKPCPSQACLRCQADVATLMQYKVKREAEIASEADAEDDAAGREAWVKPMWAMVGVTIISLFVTLYVAFAT